MTNQPKIEYDENGGIKNVVNDSNLPPFFSPPQAGTKGARPVQRSLGEVGGISSSSKRTGYTFLERLLIKHSKKVNYLLDENGQYKARQEKHPSVLRIGPTNRCTARCFYCPREYIHEPSTGYMDFGMYEGIVKYAKAHGIETLSYAMSGEPLLHPQIFEMFELARQNGLKIRMSSNAIKLDKETADKIIDFDMEAIEFSMDGYNREEYQNGKGVDQYSRAKENIEYFLREAKIRQAKTVFNIHFVNIGNVSFLNKIKYIKYWKKQLKGLNYATSFYYEPHNWAGARSELMKQTGWLDNLLSKFELKKPCVYVKGLNINWNGNVLVCCNDPHKEAIIGNIKTDSIDTIYNNASRFKYIREQEKGTFDIGYCQVCTVNSIYPLLFIKKKFTNKLISIFS